MTFGESINTCLKQKYADFNGRASRSEFWWFNLFCFFFSVIFIFSYKEDIYEIFLSALLALLALLVPWTAAAVRRLHDIDQSGWWYLITFVPYVGEFILLGILALRGTSGANRFGEAPLN
jgi:uncharacterized membrane protein YhaH (DUF805 family)